MILMMIVLLVIERKNVLRGRPQRRVVVTYITFVHVLGRRFSRRSAITKAA